MITRIKTFLGQANSAAPKRRIVVSAESLERRLALVENGLVEEYAIEREGDENIVHSIYKGQVKNIEHGLKAMFVDIGLDKNAFLHFWDAIPAAIDDLDEDGSVSANQEYAEGRSSAKNGRKRRGRGRKPAKKRISSNDIPKLYPIGSEILVQVTKGPIGNKGPRVTTSLSLAGRYLVLMPLQEEGGVNVSRKIDDIAERDRLRRIGQDLNLPANMGLIIRTMATGKRKRHLIRDLAMLLEQWAQIEQIRGEKPAPVCCLQEPGLVERSVRDFLTDEVSEVLCDDEETVERMQMLATQVSKRSKRRIKHIDTPEPIFESLGIQKQIDDAFHRQVWLPCGGYLVIDETEAMITVDVNTGRNRGSDRDMEKVLLQTNLEAAEEVARQVRLRNVGGLVVVDFIDMRSRKDQHAVYRAMKERLKRDRAKTQVLPISALGLMEMTRQRLTESLTSAMYDTCPTCAGIGRIPTTFTTSVELQRKLRSIICRNACDGKLGDLVISVHPNVMQRLREKDSALLADLERSHNGRLHFRADAQLNRAEFRIFDGQTKKQIKD